MVIAEQLASAVRDQVADPIVFCARTDLNMEGRFREMWLPVTDSEVEVWSADGERTLRLALADITGVRTREAVAGAGCGGHEAWNAAAEVYDGAGRRSCFYREKLDGTGCRRSAPGRFGRGISPRMPCLPDAAAPRGTNLPPVQGSSQSADADAQLRPPI